MADAVKVNKRALRTELEKLMNEVWMTDGEGNEITRAQLLAKMIWDKALGYVEEYRDPSTQKLVKKPHPPESWAQQFIFERLEGKAAPAIVEQEAGVKASERVRDLAKDRLNKLAVGVAGPPKIGK